MSRRLQLRGCRLLNAEFFEGRYLAGNPQHGHAIGAVGGDGQLQDVIG